MSPVPHAAQTLDSGLSDPQEQLLAGACRKNAWRLVAVLAVAYVINYLDRNSIAYAGLTMNEDLGLTARQFGWAAGVTVFSYALLEIPSNLFMQKVGARLWLSRIMITWGIAAMGGALVVGPYSLYLSRLILGAAGAGVFPGGGGIFPGRDIVPGALVPEPLSNPGVRVVHTRHTGLVAGGWPCCGIPVGLERIPASRRLAVDLPRGGRSGGVA